MLKALYDEDYVEEMTLIYWHEKHAEGEVKENSTRFIRWLQLVEEE